MSKIQKLIQKLLSNPSDLTFNELKRICNQEGFNNIFHLQSENDNIENNDRNKKIKSKKRGNRNNLK